MQACLYADPVSDFTYAALEGHRLLGWLILPLRAGLNATIAGCLSVLLGLIASTCAHNRLCVVTVDGQALAWIWSVTSCALQSKQTKPLHGP